MTAAARNDIRSLSAELAAIEFRIVTIVGVGYSDLMTREMIDEARRLTERAAQLLADVAARAEPTDSPTLT
ncbi:hypothetical protein HNV11_23725 (plasmid) [Spirosoma taeanense]|uniref:Uncharacterized protein n=1 Tax=Spirosoma taeanense TaxID=2735870 RepID=A0A6M5YFS0_9BACT|nr:hypothetical protein [Spirosoma taeanense]QJW92484.1 hypothetical protein HNV11_23725 [Spirosoma taeanense]